MQKKWTKELTNSFLSEADTLMSQVKAFRDKWKAVTNKHQEPKGDDADAITDKEADLSDCFDNFMMGEA